MIIAILERTTKALPTTGSGKEVPFGVFVLSFEKVVDLTSQGNPTNGF